VGRRGSITSLFTKLEFRSITLTPDLFYHRFSPANPRLKTIFALHTDVGFNNKLSMPMHTLTSNSWVKMDKTLGVETNICNLFLNT
jgi:hypothetical protein